MNSPSSPRSVLQKLHDQYPIFKSHLPLAIGINKQLTKLHPEISSKELVAALRHHTASTSYLKVMEKATHRFDLEGNQAGEVTQEQQGFASAQLKERFKKKMESKKLIEKAKQAQLAEQKKAEKLGQLVEKFGNQRR
ncbi:MAG: osmoprotectant transporter activator [Rhodocyclaceae bacterium]|nr:MAG: osmoprotectant transporter activator [Rhodocyclaceae bacterium]